MEKTINKNIDIIVSPSSEGSIIFEIKDPQKINRNIYSEIKKEFNNSEILSKVIYPDKKIIESQHYFIDSTTSII